jgi:glycosyltransferase AglD
MNNDRNVLDLSIVVACYNAASCLERNFYAIKEVLDNTCYKYEMILIDDKSKDATAMIIRNLKKENPGIELIFHKKNCGRGKTVYDGFRRSKGRIIGFIDIDLDNPARYIYPLVLQIDKNRADVCTAKRVYMLKPDFYLIARWIASRSYSFLVRRLLKVKLQDTETGCKFFLREKIMPVLKEVKSRGWFWDTEIMVRSYLRPLRILEIPTLFVRDSYQSTVKLAPDAVRYFLNLWSFRKRMKLLREKNNQPVRIRKAV